ncbi:E3 ubiquitin-protein ligase RING1 [Morus notabilis]|uniref:RING-type E3 ubiquitin transferase n=1 Tax=Morus notabilis TaxID=981085 RepID=W9SD14_9ROSA|nr:uncharacterized protein LOC21389073 [Morus notabilis]XP_010110344.1 uncharacterized protein LOC21389074 [Morus notabilis]EXC26030.1 E3 ubiquitin-protein ligase RING1 [Morus notabilis]EXC26031.1 E3 ubiquitin-protein ligase RING1 [Morus notabilis]
MVRIISNSPQYLGYDCSVEIDQRTFLPPNFEETDYIRFRICFSTGGLESEVVNLIGLSTFLADTLRLMADILYSSGVPSRLTRSMKCEITADVFDIVQRHNFSASLLPIHVRVFPAGTTRSEESTLERALRESAEEFQTPIPTTKSSIQALEVVKNDDADHENNVSGADEASKWCNCTICLEELSLDWNDNQTVLRMPCSHLYHRDCIVQWLEISHLCPLCRYAVPIN